MRKLNIVVVGATGYTGRTVCNYLKDKGAISWGIAGRSVDKLEALRRELSLEIPIFQIAMNQSVSLDEMCHETKCVIACAGPFTNVGMPLVDACMRCKTHYIDSTGEFNYVRLVAERYHQEAIKAGVMIVPCCGFDSVPSDIGNYLIHKLGEENGLHVDTVRAFVQFTDAGMSSGTVHSIGALMDVMDKKDMSPTSLVPADAPAPSSAPTRKGIWYDREDGRWSSPFLMAGCNERVVRRSNALRGSSASYVEAKEGSLLSAVGSTAVLYGMFTALVIPPVRRFLTKKLYPDGYGPTKKKKEYCFYNFLFIGTTEEKQKVTVELHHNQEMYDATGLFLVECALIACEIDKLGTIHAGVVTPSVAFGSELATRLENEGVQIKTFVDISQKEEKKR